MLYPRLLCLPGIAGGIALMTLSAQTPAPPKPPAAPVQDHREVRHGETVVDPYYWLREKSNPAVIHYLEAENAYTETLTKELKPFQDALYTEMLARIKQTDLSVPVRRGNYLYYARTEEGKQYPIQCRRKGSMDAPEEVLLDPNELEKTHKFVGIGAFVVSDDANLLAYTVDFTGFRQYTLQVKDLRSGATLPDTAERVTSLCCTKSPCEVTAPVRVRDMAARTECTSSRAAAASSCVTGNQPPTSFE